MQPGGLPQPPSVTDPIAVPTVSGAAVFGEAIVDLPIGDQKLGWGSMPLQQVGYELPPAQHPKKSRDKTPKPKVMPAELDIDGPTSNEAYQAALADANLTLSPQGLGFLPSNYWLNLDSTFGELVSKFFQRKNNANCRFPHKLFNALTIVDQDEKMYNLLGVKWITDRIFKVDKLIFGRVLGISSIDGGLFHKQGNFPSHGFQELSVSELEQLKGHYDISDVDLERIRLLHHRDGMFFKGCDEDSVTKCRWATEGQNVKQ